MTVLVEDVIDLSKLEHGAPGSKWEECDFRRIADNAVDSLLTTAHAADVTLLVEGPSAPMTGIPQMLHSIVFNLCENAIKYNRPGGRVEITVAPSENTTVLTVRDTGIGIPEESRQRIFERFYRVDKSRSKEVGGTGLGLSIVKHAVLLHGGKIEVESRLGEGTCFTVTLSNRPDA